MSLSKRRVLFFMSGSIAAFKACQVISILVKSGHEVQVVATKSTFEFIGAMTLEGLTGKRVLSDLWEHGRAMDHIHLTRWADFAVLCPASANTIAKLANGLADDLAAAMALAWPSEKAFWIFPAMNHEMLANAATQANLRTLVERGFKVAGTQSGSLACGEEGPGRMLEAEEIVRLFEGTQTQGEILITGGATREPIDGIRFISNVSTGQTAAAIADGLSAQGYQITYLHGAAAVLPRSARTRAFTGFQDLEENLRRELSSRAYKAVIHAAAVSDYSVAGADPHAKMKTATELTLHLKANHKILPRLKEYARNKDIRVIGFKLTLNEAPETAARALLAPSVDAVVANEWGAVARDRIRHPGTLVTRQGQTTFADLNGLNQILKRVIEGEAP